MHHPGGHAVDIDAINVACYTVPTATPESDGTLQWDATTLVLVEASAGGVRGMGYSYADVASGLLVRNLLAGLLAGHNAFDIPAAHRAMAQAVRNLGNTGIGAMAISAVDNALWDLKARLLQVSLLDLLGAARCGVQVYGSGGFTAYSIAQLQAQLGGWAEAGFGMVKMKIGRDAEADVERVRAARQAIGPAVQLMVDANGAYSARQALAQAQRFAECDVIWFEEPVPSSDLDGLALLRRGAPPGMNIAAGEYGNDAVYFKSMLAAGAVDVLQADATRCGGVSGFMQAGVLCAAHGLPFSFHCAPAMHAAAACAAPAMWVGEYFFDHQRIERMLFEGATEPLDGVLTPDRSRPGLGLELKRADAARYAV